MESHYEELISFINTLTRNIQINYKNSNKNFTLRCIKEKKIIVDDGICVAIKNDSHNTRCSRRAKPGSDCCGLHSSNRKSKFRKITDNVEIIVVKKYTFTIHSYIQNNDSFILDQPTLSPFMWRKYNCLIDYITGKVYFELKNKQLFIVTNLHDINASISFHIDML